MSSFIAKVSEIQNVESLHIVKFEFNGQSLSMMSLDLSQKVKVGVSVKLVVKPTHVFIAKIFDSEISCLNRLQADIVSLENGQLLSSLKLSLNRGELESIITREASDRMNLRVGDRVTAFIQESELSIGEILDD